jgi:Tol biopolymer transport system component
VASEDRPVDDLAFPLGPLKALDPGTGATRTLLAGEVVAFFWSPDGKTIAALALSPEDEDIVGVPGAGFASARRPVPGSGAGAEPPPNQGVPLMLVFVDVASGSVSATRPVEVTSRYVNNILPYYDQYALSHRHWSPDSSAIALPLEADGEEQLFVIPADGSEATPLSSAVLGFWSP